MTAAADGWAFHNPVQVRFGRGIRGSVVDDLASGRCLVVTSARGRRQFLSDPVLSALPGRVEIAWVDGVTENPDLEWLESERRRLRSQPFDAVIGFGGGSALDTAKVLAVSLVPELQGIPLLRMLTDASRRAGSRSAPLFAIPTTAGTGSEVTPFATVWDRSARRKYSLAGPDVYPKMAVVDPDLTDDLPLEVTLSTGLDAVNQAAESIWNRNMTPVSGTFATRALALGMEALPILMGDLNDRRAREAMAECGVLAGLAISQTRTALCHSISYPITAHFGVPHGLACAFTMTAVLEHGLAAAQDDRFDRLTQALNGKLGANHELLARFEAFESLLGVRSRVREFIPSLDALLALSSEMHTPNRAGNFLGAVDDTLIERLLRSAYGPVDGADR